jgi:hypothetical protein
MERQALVALIVAAATSAAFAQPAPEQVPVRRPDGSIVHPDTSGAAKAPEVVPAMRPDGSVVHPSAAGITPNVPEAAPVRRPDGSVVYPTAPDTRQRPPSVTSGESVYRAEERERMREEAQRAADDRVERSRREREAAATSPARQIPPTTGPR